MNYNTATDFELNKRLLELSCPLDTTITEVYEHRLAGKLKTFSHVMFKVDGCDDEFKVNYCTDWNVTMPLAIEYGVSLIHDDQSGKYGVVIGLNEQIWVEKCKTLRTIVICLIEVLESQQ